MTNIKIVVSPPNRSVKVVTQRGDYYTKAQVDQKIAAVSISGGVVYLMASSLQWIVVHNLSIRPQVSCTDSAGEVIYGDVRHISDNEVHIFHTFPQAGRVYIN